MKQAREAFVVVDLGYGDAGKGTIVDYLVRRRNAHTVIRFNGGPQAAHNVITPDGRHHTFSQFGSGTLVPGTGTHLSRYVLIDPMSMMSEERHLRHLGVYDAFRRTTIHEAALVITPFQRSANRLREMARGSGRHGSCGMGVGEAMADSLELGDRMVFARDLREPAVLEAKLRFLQRYKRNQIAEFLLTLPTNDAVDRELDVLCERDAVDHSLQRYGDFMSRARIVDNAYERALMNAPGALIFEAAQGVLLDEWHGFHPFTTWSTTTCANADALLKAHQYRGNVTRLGVLRAYSTRHGPGPFVTEDDRLTKALADAHNVLNDWQGSFRCGWLDLAATRYALEVAGRIDRLAVTSLDRIAQLPEWRTCNAYQYVGGEAQALPQGFHVDPRDAKRIHGIKPQYERDLTYQEKLTNRLIACQPVYRKWAADEASYLNLLEDELRRPIGIVSRGPTAEDKECRGGFLRPAEALATMT